MLPRQLLTQCLPLLSGSSAAPKATASTIDLHSPGWPSLTGCCCVRSCAKVMESSSPCLGVLLGGRKQHGETHAVAGILQGPWECHGKAGS